MNKKIFRLALAGIIAAMYIVLTLPFAQFTFGMVQFRLAEALTVLPLLTSSVIPGVFIGCLISNFLNPMNLGLIDILGGSFTTLIAAVLTFLIGKYFRDYYFRETETTYSFKSLPKRQKASLLLSLLPPVLLNGLIVGLYLPFLLMDNPTIGVILTTNLSISISQAVVIYGIGFPLILLLIKNRLVKNYFEQAQ